MAGRSCRSATAISASTRTPTPTSPARSRRPSTGSTRLPQAPAFMLHTGDITHLSKPEEFDTRRPADRRGAGCRRSTCRASTTCSVDDGAAYLERYGKGTKGAGWYSFDHERRAFRRPGQRRRPEGRRPGPARRRAARLARGRPEGPPGQHADRRLRPHPAVGGLSANGAGAPRMRAQALAYLKRFGSVTVLNGHIHQIMQKVEGNVTFHTAMSTAFPQPKPGEAASPGPDEGAGRPAASAAGDQRRRLHRQPGHAGDRRPAAGGGLRPWRCAQF